jgi:hypothetical protein
MTMPASDWFSVDVEEAWHEARKWLLRILILVLVFLCGYSMGSYG